MATHDYIISNASGAAVRADLNNALAAIASNNSSATEPTTTYAYQWWADTGSSPTVMKLRNAANSAWITLFQLDGEWSLIPFENGTAAAPSIYFKDSGTDTGIFSPGADQVAITTGGTQRATVDASGKLLVNTSSTSSTCLADFRSLPGLTGGTTVAFSRGDGGTAGDQELGTLLFTNSSGNRAASIAVQTEAGWGGAGSADYPGKIIFSTTADGASSPTPRATIDSSGRLLVGTSSSFESTSKLQVKDGSLNIYHASAAAGAGYAILFTSDGSSSALAQAKIEGLQEAANTSGGRLVFSTSASGSGSPTERMRIDNKGSLSLWTPGNTTAGPQDVDARIFAYSDTSNSNLYIDSRRSDSFIHINQTFGDSANRGAIAFYRNESQIGSISISSAQVFYNTTSDYRLKENIVDLENATALVKQLKPRSFNFISEPDTAINGFIAHEVQAVAPEAVTGEKDAIDDEGNPKYQGIDQSKLVPLLTAALQEALTRIEQLEAAVTALQQS